MSHTGGLLVTHHRVGFGRRGWGLCLLSSGGYHLCHGVALGGGEVEGGGGTRGEGEGGGGREPHTRTHGLHMLQGAHSRALREREKEEERWVRDGLSR